MAEDKWQRRQRLLTAKYATMIEELYKEAAREAAAIGVSLDDVLPDTKMFSFADYPSTRKRVEALFDEFKNNLQATIENGITAAWELSESKNDELVNKALGKRAVAGMTDKLRKRYFAHNEDARAAFLKRKTAGLNLSDRVWNYTNQFKEEIELALDVGLGQGKSADELSRDVRGYLKYPDKLFRRVRDKHGNLKLSKAAAAFHPGRGVYRSSYKNARRMTATECNIAYRSADYERWQQLDFVVGIRIVRSNNHPEADICDELSAPNGSLRSTGKGCYPKDFKFTGWHPQCRCHVETIMKTQREMADDTERILRGEEPTAGSVNTVAAMPDEFTAWVKNNQGRILAAEQRGSLPYFIRDNRAAVDNILNPKPKELTTLEKAELRHKARTQAEIDDIRRRAAERQARHEAMRKEAADALAEAMDYAEVDYAQLQKYIDAGDLDRMFAEAAVVRKRSADMKVAEQALETLIPDVHAWHKQFTLLELQATYDSVDRKLSAIAKLSIEEQANKLRFEAVDYLGGNMRDVQRRYKTWEVSQKAYFKALKDRMPQFETEMVNHALLSGDIDTFMNETYEACALALMKEAYPKQKSMLSATERKQYKAAYKRYINHPPINPHYEFGAAVGGVYSANVKQSAIKEYFKTYAGAITMKELSVIQRFTNGSTFSNCYNFRNTSAYWRKVYAQKMASYTSVEEKEMCELIEDWSHAANLILDKMERYEGVTFRGLKGDGALEIINQLTAAHKQGKTWINVASASLSTMFSVAENFDGTCILIIKNKRGAWIDPISEFKEVEREVMTLRGAEYKVVSPPKPVGGRYFVVLEEI